MTKLTDINTRVRLLLEDPDARRFSDTLLLAALRQALDEINLRLPRLRTVELTVSTSSRDQVLSGVEDCLFITGIFLQSSTNAISELSPETQFTYTLKDGVPALHFSGTTIPKAGGKLTVNYAAGYLIEGLDGETSTTLPAACENALVNGTAAQVCFLRAGSLLEGYGSRTGESSRLMEIGNLWLKVFDRSLKGLRVMQEFGFPPGFTLDHWDELRR